MDTEKLKQMGRDYFKANPDWPARPLSDPILKATFWEHDGSIAELISQWRAGYNEARYAASKEGRAIELLGRLFMENPSKELRPAWVEAGAFLQEIGWKPNP